MLDIEQELCKILEAGGTPSIWELGGASRLSKASETLCNSPLAPEFVRVAIDNYSESDRESQHALEQFVLCCLNSLSNELQAKEIIELIGSCEWPTDIEEECFRSLLSIVQATDKPPMTRAFALDASMPYACKVPKRRYRLLSLLLEISTLDTPLFLKHAAKIIGVANNYWPNEEILELLREFVDIEEVEGEASYEIGISYVAKALNSHDKKNAYEHFANAISWFRHSIEATSLRPDAELYVLCLTFLINHSSDQPYAESLTSVAAKLHELAFVFEAWFDSTGLPSWLGARRIELSGWLMLAISLEDLASTLVQPSWFDAKSVIEQQILTAYTAGRSFLNYDRSSGIEAILRPHIENSIIKQEGQLHHLKQWIERSDTSSWKDIAEELIDNINKRLEASTANPTVATPDKHTGVAMLEKYQVPSPIVEAYKSILDINSEHVSPALNELITNCCNELNNFYEYRDNEQIRSTFLPVLTLTLRFLQSRMDHTKGHLSQIKYLFQHSPLPSEGDLQNDYYQYMYGLMLNTFVEVSDIGGGRADVLFEHKGIRFVSELKKEEIDCSFDHLEKEYSSQGTEYQNTNIRLGILLVLDLTEKPMGANHLSNQVKVCSILRKGENVPRGLVIIKIPARRKTPSQLS